LWVGRPASSDPFSYAGAVEPVTGYASVAGQRVAYQVIGDGPIDLVIAPSWFSSFDLEWEEPRIRLYLERLAAFTRIIRIDRRGSGASDPIDVDGLPPWEAFAGDIAAVMDAVGSADAAIYADGDGGPVAVLFAATHPDRVRALVLFSTSVRFLVADDYPIGMPPDFADTIADTLTENWGTGEQLAVFVPSRADDPSFQRWMGRLMRATTSPSRVRAYIEGVIVADAREALETIEAPTMVLHPTSAQFPSIDHARYIAEHVPDGTLVELSGPGDAYPYFALADQTLSAIREFLVGTTSPPVFERSLATVLFTDIVDSTAQARTLGDGEWHRLLDLHDEIARTSLDSHRGHLVKQLGDGILATFDGPGRALGFAAAFARAIAAIGLDIRTGIHTGEVEHRGDDIGGLAVHLGARIMAAAGPGEILVSRTVKDLVMGSGIAFEDRGTRPLKGIDGEWQLFAAVAPSAAAAS
jgi:class 3 adenylate cyclase